MTDWTNDSEPALLRIRMTTAMTPDLETSESAYSQWLGYELVARGRVAHELAQSWGAPAVAGAPYVVLRTGGDDFTYVRLIEAEGPLKYTPLTTFGWAAFEIIAKDVYALAERLKGSPFVHIDGPKPLQFMPSIVAMQWIGPGGECLYFTMETGARESSLLPAPTAFVGRTFIVVAAGADFPSMLDWYVDRFSVRQRPVRQSKIAIVQRAQGLSADHAIPLSAVGLKRHGNLLELDGYPTGPGYAAAARPCRPGALPPANAMVTFEVADISTFAPLALAPVGMREDPGYGGARACVLRGPAGELLELVEAR